MGRARVSNLGYVCAEMWATPIFTHLWRDTLKYFYLFFCVCTIALLKNQQHPTYGLGKVRTFEKTGGWDLFAPDFTK